MRHLLDQVKGLARSNRPTPPFTRQIMDVSRGGAPIDELSARVRVEGHKALSAPLKGRRGSADDKSIDEAENDHREHHKSAEQIA